MQYNTWTRRHEFLYTKRIYKNGHKKFWTTTQNEEGDEALQDAAVEAETPCAKRARLENSSRAAALASAPDPKAKGKGRGKGKKDTKPKPTPEEIAEKEEAKKLASASKKKLGAKLSKVKNLKIRCDAAQSRMTDMLTARTTPIWKRWCSDVHFVEVLAAKEKLDLFKNSSEVWSAWAVQPAFEIYARRNFELEVLEVQLSRSAELEPLITSLEKECSRLLEMHTASTRA